MTKRIKQQYGIKYPFTTNSNNGYFIDTNASIKSKIRSILMHVVFTPKGQKIRDPQFGTDLIKNIFEPNEDITWGKVQDAIGEAISKYLPNVLLKTIEMLKNEEDPSEVFVKIVYSINNGTSIETDSVVTAL